MRFNLTVHCPLTSINLTVLFAHLSDVCVCVLLSCTSLSYYLVINWFRRRGSIDQNGNDLLLLNEPAQLWWSISFGKTSSNSWNYLSALLCYYCSSLPMGKPFKLNCCWTNETGTTVRILNFVIRISNERREKFRLFCVFHLCRSQLHANRDNN